jgi:hypothetical protein
VGEVPAASRRRLRPAIIVAVAIAAAVVTAWALQATLTSGGEQSKGGPSGKVYSITVERYGQLLKRYDVARLRALPQARIVIDGKTQAGPSLKTLLADAGANDYRKVDVRGAGLRDSGHLTLSARQVGQKVQLDFAERGTVKVCGPSLYHAQWVRDVLSIDVR